MARKSGPSTDPDGIGRPEITMMGIEGCCWRTCRMVSNPSMPGMKMSRKRRSNLSLELCEPVAAIAGRHNVMAGPLQ